MNDAWKIPRSNYCKLSVFQFCYRNELNQVKKNKKRRTNNAGSRRKRTWWCGRTKQEDPGARCEKDSVRAREEEIDGAGFWARKTKKICMMCTTIKYDYSISG
jgi:hypothetical protein